MPPQIHAQQEHLKPWSLWATIGFSALIFIMLTVLQTVVFILFMVFVMAGDVEIQSDDFLSSWAYNGSMLSLAITISSLFCISSIIALVKLKKTLSVKQYLALSFPERHVTRRWFLILFIFLPCADAITVLFDRDIVPEFMVQAYQTTFFIPFLWLAIVFMSPMFEEMFFRGFMFKGIQDSKLGNLGAIIITSLSWTVIHFQYDVFEMSIVFAGGILLGLARVKSGSMLLTLLMHCLWNLIAMIETTLYFHW
ncbi:lysostaphin resistance A-like protein [candidate division CSSED10-310 bacterium]|uniref:Lysostaphin resistance A-like protein n=1 Tax=candidate division CSSED10-310 bacterium TaxID=2855610 RepID=A0ABV6YYD0_UNCC1